MIWILGWIAQVVLVVTLPEVADEAYYERWGEVARLGYLDHPPAVAWWSSLGGRWLNLTLLPIAWLLFAQSARRLGAQLNPEILIAIAWWTPLGLSSGVLVTPDAPLLLGWSLAVWGFACQRPLISAVGVAWGAWSKAMIWPAALGLAWLWWTDQRHSRDEHAHDLTRLMTQRRTRFFLWSSVILALYAPHLAWSYTHEGLPWTFQGSRQWGRFSTLEWLAGQVLVGGGMWGIALTRSYLDYIQDGRTKVNAVTYHDEMSSSHQLFASERARIWWWLSAPSAFLWLGVSLGTRVEANWSALAWPMGLVWVLDRLPERAYRRYLASGIIVTLPCLFLPLVHLVIPIGSGPPRAGEKLAHCLDKSVEPSPPSMWIAGRYQEAALLKMPLQSSDATRNDHPTRTAHHPGGASAKHTLLGAPLIYQRAWERRRSQYDLEGSRNLDARPYDAFIPCQAAYLGPPHWLGPRCQGEPRLFRPALNQCGLYVTRCLCAPGVRFRPKPQR